MKKEKKHKKEKKSKKSKKKDDSDSDEWVEKVVGSATEPKPAVSVPLQRLVKLMLSILVFNYLSMHLWYREEWMSVPAHLPTFSKNQLTGPKRSSLGQEEEAARKMMMEKPGQTSRELNPYWKNGGTGLPPTKEEADAAKKSESPERKKHKSSHGRRSRSRSTSKSPERRTRHERNRSPEANKPRFRHPSEEDRQGSSSSRSRFSGSSSQPGWKKAEPKRPITDSSSSSSSSSESEDEVQQPLSRPEDDKIWTEQELNALNAKIIKAEIMGQQVWFYFNDSE